MAQKAFVLLSGGLDSTTCLHKAIFDFGRPDTDEDIRKRIENNYEFPGCDPIPWVEAISVDYGQRHAKEYEYANKTCEILGIKHTTLSIPGLLADKNTMLTNKDKQIPDVDYNDLPEGVSPTYVPFRNGTMLSIITAHAQKWVNEGEGDDYNTAGVYFGAHAEDAQRWAYPDCTPEFIGAMANAIYIGSYNKIRLHAPLSNMLKWEVVSLGYDLGVRFENTWSCYKGEEHHCGVCPTCRSRKAAFDQAGVLDPTIYANS